MKCKKQYRFHKLPISNLWEVNLEEELWNRLKRAAYSRNCTFSWISRYCVFRIARRKQLFIPPAMEILSNEVKTIYKKTRKKHRHIICLYGEDEKLIRLTAMHLQMTVSHLIRLALYRYLPKIEKRSFNWRFIYYYGTRICRYIDITRSSQKKFPFFDHYFYTKWPIESWWRRPYPYLYIPFTPDARYGPSWYYGAINSGSSDIRLIKWHLNR